jgi:F-type H+-transporting ATPase subunit a
VIGLKRHGLHFLSFFVPKGVPIAMLVLVVPIEVLSYFMRPISHSVRLFANMTAGHTMLKVFGKFIVDMLAANAALMVASILPFALIVALTGLELLIAVLQAYVFTILTCLYINDAVHLEH